MSRRTRSSVTEWSWDKRTGQYRCKRPRWKRPGWVNRLLDVGQITGRWLAAALLLEDLCQPMPHVAMGSILLGFVEDFVPSPGVAPVFDPQLALPHVAGDEFE